MKLIFLYILAFLLADISKAKNLPDNYAILVSGSENYWNYHHTATICKLYHLLIRNGLPVENVHLLMKKPNYS